MPVVIYYLIFSFFVSLLISGILNVFLETTSKMNWLTSITFCAVLSILIATILN